MNKKLISKGLLAVLAASLPVPAFAHSGADTSGLVQGFPSRLQGRIAWIQAHGQRHAISGGRANKRRAANMHVLDGAGKALQAIQLFNPKVMGQPSLINDLQGLGVSVPPQGSIGCAVNFHE